MAPELGAFPVNYGICSVDFAARLNIQTVVVQLAVQFVAVGDHDQRRVLHRRLLQQLARKQHMDMLLPCLCQNTPALCEPGCASSP